MVYPCPGLTHALGEGRRGSLGWLPGPLQSCREGRPQVSRPRAQCPGLAYTPGVDHGLVPGPCSQWGSFAAQGPTAACACS